MPQMAPMSWTLLSIIFFSMTIMFSSITYFNTIYHKETTKLVNKNNLLVWKW